MNSVSSGVPGRRPTLNGSLLSLTITIVEGSSISTDSIVVKGKLNGLPRPIAPVSALVIMSGSRIRIRSTTSVLRA